MIEIYWIYGVVYLKIINGTERILVNGKGSKKIF